jgi:ethylmalonyl-CoA/methylmalonyl-CoA decarboxylase
MEQRMSRGTLRLEIDGPIAKLALDNPKARNAMSHRMMNEFPAVVERLEESECVALLIYGADGSAFCAGGDLRDVRSSLLNRGGEMCDWMTASIDRMAALPMYIFGCVEGAALGGGAELLTACDEVICSSDATIGFVQASLGVSTGWGGGRRLIQKVGPKKALSLLAFSRKLSADEASSAGLVDEIVEPGATVQKALERAEALTAIPASSLQAVIGLVRQPEKEPAFFRALWGGEAHLRALGIES